MNITDVFEHTNRQTVIKFDNADIFDIYTGIHSGTLKLKRTLCANSNDVMFGGCIASQFEAVIEGVEDITGERIKVVQLLDGDSEKELSLFEGVISTCELEPDRLSYKIIAYDDLYEAGKKDVMDWYKNIGFPISAYEMLTSLLDYINIPVCENLDLYNNISISETVFGSLNAVDILKAICELNGGFGVINADGEFDIVYLNTEDGIELHALSGFKLSTYYTEPIGRVAIRATENDIGGGYGTGNNPYIVQGNFLVYGKTTDELNAIAESLYAVIGGLSWRPCTFDIPISNPLIGITGERYNVITSQGDDIYTYIFDTTFSDVQLLSQNLASYGDEQRSNNIDDEQRELMVLNSKTFEISKSVDGMSLQVSNLTSDVEGKTEQINQLEFDVNGINLQIEQMQKQLDGNVVVYTATEVPTLDNYPADTWFIPIYPPESDEDAEDYQFPSDNTWQFSYDETRKHVGAVVYVEGTPNIYRFIINENKEFEWLLLENTELSYLISQVVELQATVGGLTSRVSNTEIDVSKNAANIVKNTSSIQQNADAITTKVEKNNIISQINQTAEAITIDAKKINLNGVVTANNNFKILKDGSMEAKNGKFSGHLTTTDGQIAGWQITEDALYKDVKLSSGSTRRIYIKSSNLGSDSDWVISIQDNESGRYVGKFIVQGDGSLYCKNLDVSLLATFSNPVTMNSTLTANGNIESKGLLTSRGDIACYGKLQSKSSFWVDGISYINNDMYFRDGTSSTDARIRFRADGLRSYFRDGLSIGSTSTSDADKLYVNGSTNLNGALKVTGATTITGSLRVSGTKNRIVDTEHYGKRCLNAYEMATAMFGDIGTATLDDNGECIIYIDDVFREVIDETELYQVFLQSYSEYIVYVDDVCYNYFKVKGHPNCKFAWEIKGKQKGYADLRLEEMED